MAGVNGKHKHYSFDEIKEKGYIQRIPLDANHKLTSNCYLRLLYTRDTEGVKESIKDVALKIKDRDYFEIAESISHRPLNKGNLATLYTINYSSKDEEQVDLSEIETLLMKENGNELNKIWKKLSDLNKAF